MGGNPRAGRPHRVGPSPLQQVHLTRPLSTAPPTSGLVRDPQFWKRFSVAVHAAEIDVEAGGRGVRSNSSGSSSSGMTEKYGRGDEWLAQQHHEKRRCRICCMSITLVVILVVAGAAFAGWYFTKGRKQMGAQSQ